MLTVIYWMEHRVPNEVARESNQGAKGVCNPIGGSTMWTNQYPISLVAYVVRECQGQEARVGVLGSRAGEGIINLEWVCWGAGQGEGIINFTLFYEFIYIEHILTVDPTNLNTLLFLISLRFDISLIIPFLIPRKVLSLHLNLECPN
jgi:hypothetical protein